MAAAVTEIKVSTDIVSDVIPKVNAFIATLQPTEQAAVALLLNGSNIAAAAHADVALFDLGATVGAGVQLTGAVGTVTSLLNSVTLTATQAGGLALGLANAGTGAAVGGAGLGAAAAAGGGGAAAQAGLGTTLGAKVSIII